MGFPCGQTVTVWLETKNRLGDITVSGERTVEGCAVAPRTSTETNDARRATVTTGLTMYAPPDSGITAQHRIRLADGSLWEVEGAVGRWRSPYTGWYPGDQIELQQVTG
jgi:hypothetical protein